jgi:hypothetical protein
MFCRAHGNGTLLLTCVWHVRAWGACWCAQGMGKSSDEGAEADEKGAFVMSAAEVSLEPL